MKAIIYKGVRDIEVQERDMPVCGADDVIVRNVRAGICGTDINGYLYGPLHGGIYPQRQEGNEFGHEMVGYVYETGKNVTAVKVGDRVFVNPNTRTPNPSEACMACAFSQYVLVQNAKLGYNLYLLPASLSFDHAVLIEPFSVATHGKNTPHTRPDDNVIIYGAGTIGLCALGGLIAQGNKKVVVIDLDDHRLEIAGRIGAKTLNPRRGNGDLYAFLKEQVGELSNTFRTPVIDVDVVIDCAGAPNILLDFLTYAKPGAKLSCVGMHKQEDAVDFNQVMSKEAVIMGSRAFTPDDINEVIDNLANNKSEVTRIITHRFKIDDAKQAFETASDPLAGYKGSAGSGIGMILYVKTGKFTIYKFTIYYLSSERSFFFALVLLLLARTCSACSATRIKTKSR